jgi:hypothetical protein
MTTTPLFPLGHVVATRNALSTLTPEEIATAIARHASGDWGEVPPDAWAENELSLKEGFRLFSVYRARDQKFWIITESDRSATTVLLPEDY